jgi:hypothetical protein
VKAAYGAFFATQLAIDLGNLDISLSLRIQGTDHEELERIQRFCQICLSLAVSESASLPSHNETYLMSAGQIPSFSVEDYLKISLNDYCLLVLQHNLRRLVS